KVRQTFAGGLPEPKTLEAQRDDFAHAGEFVQLLGDAGRDRVVDGNQRDRFAFLLTAAEVEGGNVDPVLAELGAERTDEPRRVGVDDVDHLPGQLGLNRDAEDVHQARRAV